MIASTLWTSPLWPVHLKPKPDELLSSWIVRLCHAHGYKVQAGSRLLFGAGASIWNRDIDKFAPTTVIEAMSLATGASVERVQRSTLSCFAGVLYENIVPIAQTPWVLPLGIRSRDRMRPALQACPSCLAADDEPYYRTHWRLGCVTACLTHGHRLIDQCPQCKAPIAPHRTDFGSRRDFPSRHLIRCCQRCRFDLRMATTKQCSSSELADQTFLMNAIEGGPIDINAHVQPHPLAFFAGLLALTRMHAMRPRGNRLASSDLAEAGKHGEDIDHRVHVLNLAMRSIDTWPVQFIKDARQRRLTYSDLLRAQAPLPFWIDTVARSELGRWWAPLSATEAAAIARGAERRHGVATPSSCRAISGRDTGRRFGGRLVVNDETFEQLIAGIDHEIAGCLEPARTFDLLTDKVMFIAARTLRLSQDDLAALKVSDVQELSCDRVDFWTRPITPAMAQLQLAWCAGKLRQQIELGSACEYVFVSAQTKRPLRRSAIGRRFQTCVRRAGLQRLIPSYHSWASGGLARARTLLQSGSP